MEKLKAIANFLFQNLPIISDLFKLAVSLAFIFALVFIGWKAHIIYIDVNLWFCKADYILDKINMGVCE